MRPSSQSHLEATISQSLDRSDAILADPFGSLLGVIGEDDVGARTAEAGEGLEGDLSLIEPATLSCRLEHGVFTGDVVGGDRQIARLPETVNHVEVRQPRLNHQHIRTLELVEGGLDEGLTAVGRVLLVRLLVAKAGVRVERVAEGAVVRRGVLGRVSEDRHVRESVRVERVTDSADTAIHHVGRGDDVAARACLHDGLLAQLLDRVVVENFAVLDNAVVALARIRVERDVGADDRIGQRILEHCNGARHDPIRIVGLLTSVGLECVVNLGENDERAHTILVCILRLGDHALQAVALTSWHGGDRHVGLVVMNEERVDEVGGRHDVLTNHAPHVLAFAVAPRPRPLLHPRPAARVGGQHTIRHLNEAFAFPQLRRLWSENGSCDIRRSAHI
mmetsp:Transcript_66113/g.131132  ORF Transcript_66113/g.131132 Transcript_66113/m.131132 type:complete len:391 (+) Transcript_66113:420-1592(+)